MTTLRTVIWTTFIFLLVSSSACSTNRKFSGKVIDADTLKPIEGALVVAVWNKTRFGGLLDDTRFKDAKETLTDENGEWAIVGLEGNNSKIRRFLQYLGVFRTKNPSFDIYKPGYTEFVAFGNFSAWPCISQEHNLEGIILSRPGDTKEERKKFFEKLDLEKPFIPVKNPEKKLRDLDFSFEYPENVNTVGNIWLEKNKVRRYWLYTVVGIRKARTRKEELSATHCLSIDERLLPLSAKMAREERERLLGTVSGKAK